MKKLAILALLLIAPYAPAFAGELDNEERVKNAQRLAQNLPQTLVVRVSESGSVAVMHSNESLPGGAGMESGAFVEMTASDRMRGELDGDSSSSGWYFYWNNFSYTQPVYFFYGFHFYYQPYHSFHYNNHWYHWYRWRRW
jgi:hypothetical protein